MIAWAFLAPSGLLADEIEPRIMIGMAGDVLAPTGRSFKEFYNTGFGVSLRGQYEFCPYIAAILTASYVSFPADPPEGIPVEDASMIPVVAGLKASLPVGSVRFFVALDAGITSVERWVASSAGTGVSSSTMEFTWQPHLGFETRLGSNSSVEISTRYVALSGNEAIGIRMGILFGI